MRAVTIFLGLLIVISLAVWKSDAQDDPPVGATEQATVNSTVSNSEVETPAVGNLDVSEVPPTAQPTDLPLAIDTLTPTDMVFPTETAPPELGATASPSDLVPSITPSSTVQFVETQPIELTKDATTPQSVTATEQPTTESIACEIDRDTDGVVTDRDLSEIGRELLNNAVNETTSMYDLNANLQIDIGDLQKMVAYLLTTCPN